MDVPSSPVTFYICEKLTRAVREEKKYHVNIMKWEIL